MAHPTPEGTTIRAQEEAVAMSDIFLSQKVDTTQGGRTRSKLSSTMGLPRRSSDGTPAAPCLSRHSFPGSRAWQRTDTYVSPAGSQIFQCHQPSYAAHGIAQSDPNNTQQLLPRS